MLPAVNMTPVMAVRVRTVQMSAVLRVTLSPVLDDLPFIGGVALSFMTQPYLDFDLRYCPSHGVPGFGNLIVAAKLQCIPLLGILCTMQCMSGVSVWLLRGMGKHTTAVCTASSHFDSHERGHFRLDDGHALGTEHDLERSPALQASSWPRHNVSACACQLHACQSHGCLCRPDDLVSSATCRMLTWGIPKLHLHLQSSKRHS